MKTLITWFRCIWLGLELNSAGTPGSTFPTPDLRNVVVIVLLVLIAFYKADKLSELYVLFLRLTSNGWLCDFWHSNNINLLWCTVLINTYKDCLFQTTQNTWSGGGRVRHAIWDWTAWLYRFTWIWHVVSIHIYKFNMLLRSLIWQYYQQYFFY